MDITPIIPQGKKVLNAYGDGGFVINGESYQCSVIIAPDAVIPLKLDQIANVTIENVLSLTRQTPPVELLLVGTGKSMVQFPSNVRAALREHNIVVELMDTGAACRTYNILLSEERRVAALLIAV